MLTPKTERWLFKDSTAFPGSGQKMWSHSACEDWRDGNVVGAQRGSPTWSRSSGGPESYQVRLPSMCDETPAGSQSASVCQLGRKEHSGTSRCRKIQEGVNPGLHREGSPCWPKVMLSLRWSWELVKDFSWCCIWRVRLWYSSLCFLFMSEVLYNNNS